jgi:predicted nucleotidyltransferase
MSNGISQRPILFGSMARGETKPGSELICWWNFGPAATPGCLKWAR